MKSPTITITMPNHFIAGIASPYIIHTANAVIAGITLQNALALATPILRTTKQNITKLTTDANTANTTIAITDIGNTGLAPQFCKSNIKNVGIKNIKLDACTQNTMLTLVYSPGIFRNMVEYIAADITAPINTTNPPALTLISPFSTTSIITPTSDTTIPTIFIHVTRSRNSTHATSGANKGIIAITTDVTVALVIANPYVSHMK